MTQLGRLIHLLVAASFGMLLFACLQPLTAAAQALPPPLPLPDVTIYGTVVQDGQLLEEGAVKALLPNGVAVTAPIQQINGTAYNYALTIPLFMTATTTLSDTGAGILTGDMIAFFVDGQPAFYQDPATQLTMRDLKILAQGAATTAAGRSYGIDLTMRGAESYPLGDVNATGMRSAADALLALKYDIGLIIGVTAFPPGPNTVYLPLCDIVENGRCDSSDALRILQCDVGLSSVTCPADRIAARAHTQQTTTTGAPVSLRAVATAEADPDTVAVQVVLGDPTAQFGAATLELDYDPTLFTVIDCTENPTGALDLVSCNAAYAPGVVRFNGIGSAGSVDGAPLVAVRFRRLGVTTVALNTFFGLRADGIFDQAGEDLAWNDGAEAPTSTVATFKVFMPAVTNQSDRPGASVAETPEAPAPQSTLSYLLHLPMIGAYLGGATEASATPPAAGESAEVISATTVLSETEVATETGVITQIEVVTAAVVITATGDVTDTVTPDQSSEPADSAPAQGSGSSQPTTTPVAHLPNKEQPDESDDGQRLYLPLITE